jgi:hypothetical protein
MSQVSTGDCVVHPDFGRGTVIERLGAQVRVNFFGEEIAVNLTELTPCEATRSAEVAAEGDARAFIERQKFHQVCEAINLGIVPPDHELLLSLTIDRDRMEKAVSRHLRGAREEGLCKVVFGYYGAGKSHYLNFVRAVAFKAGWVVSLIEFDPKAADPAKPHLVYRSLMSALEFPRRQDGSQSRGFLGFIKETRNQWHSAGIPDLPYFSANPWYSAAFETLLAHRHDEQDETYVAACGWLAGERQPLKVVHDLARDAEISARVPRMPATKETAEIYAFHFVVVNEICRALGYKGLLLVLDEAEHVRGYNVKRQGRANNFFDLLARCAHKPLRGVQGPVTNEHGWKLPEFWNEGPHFGLYVGLTDLAPPVTRDTELRDICVFLHEEGDRIFLRKPKGDEFEMWCLRYLEAFHHHYPESTRLFAEKINRTKIAAVLRKEYDRAAGTTSSLRNWTKLAGLASSIQIVRQPESIQALIEPLRSAARVTAEQF